ncbi:MAG: hypothetical protein E6X17_06090 [Sporomusaceae bacterium]|nr:hypothetical protein [Sporomusaceae bacterium]
MLKKVKDSLVGVIGLIGFAVWMFFSSGNWLARYKHSALKGVVLVLLVVIAILTVALIRFIGGR